MLGQPLAGEVGSGAQLPGPGLLLARHLKCLGQMGLGLGSASRGSKKQLTCDAVDLGLVHALTRADRCDGIVEHGQGLLVAA